MLASLCVTTAMVQPVFAKDGDSGDDDSSDSDSSGSDSDSDGDDNSDDDGGSEDGGGSNSGKGSSDDNDHDDARDAVRKGKAMSLSKALGLLKKSEPGRVIEVKLVKRSSGYDYRFKVVTAGGKVKAINMDAKTGRIRGFFGL